MGMAHVLLSCLLGNLSISRFKSEQEKNMIAGNRNEIEKAIVDAISAYNDRNIELTLSHFHFDENFIGYSLDGSKITSRDDFMGHLKYEFSQTNSLQINVMANHVSIYRTMSIFSGECVLRASDEQESHLGTVEVNAEGNVFTLKKVNIDRFTPIPFRFTAVLRQIHDSWKINQLHFSGMAVTRAA